MKVRLALEYEVEDEDPEVEKAAMEIIREEADRLADAVKRRLTEAGAQVTSFRANYERSS
jgi:hypothetical protein